MLQEPSLLLGAARGAELYPCVCLGSHDAAALKDFVRIGKQKHARLEVFMVDEAQAILDRNDILDQSVTVDLTPRLPLLQVVVGHLQNIRLVHLSSCRESL